MTLIEQREHEAERTRAAAAWKALRTGYWGTWDAQPAIFGGYTLSPGQEFRRLRQAQVIVLKRKAR
jgi:hypothetical protein